MSAGASGLSASLASVWSEGRGSERTAEVMIIPNRPCLEGCDERGEYHLHLPPRRGVAPAALDWYRVEIPRCAAGECV